MYRAIAVAPAAALFLWLSAAAAAELDGISGSMTPDSVMPAPPFPAVSVADRPRPRSFPGQPPTTPHAIRDDYKFGMADNRCVLCHTPSSPADMVALTDAPSISASHLVLRDGKAAREVTASHRFCLSCHVVQTDASPPVANTYRSAGDGSR
jgi:cytochrome c-type protein NapB